MNVLHEADTHSKRKLMVKKKQISDDLGQYSGT